MVRSYVCYFACFGLVVLTPCMPLQYGDRNHPVISKNSPYTTNTTCNGVKFVFFFIEKIKTVYLKILATVLRYDTNTRVYSYGTKQAGVTNFDVVNEQTGRFFHILQNKKKNLLLIFLSFFFNVLGGFPSSGFKAAA